MGSSKQTTEYRRLTNKCVRCGGVDAFILVGRHYCADCVEKVREYSKKYKETHKEEINRKKRETRDARKESGLCIRCQKKLPANYRWIQCHSCLEKDRIHCEKYRKKKKVN